MVVLSPGEPLKFPPLSPTQRLECPLFDIERYAHHLESGYDLMWENYVSGEPPRHIEIPRDGR